MKEAVGVTGIFTIFGTAALLEGVFIYVALPETKNRTLQEIEDYFQVNYLILRDVYYSKIYNKNYLRLTSTILTIINIFLIPHCKIRKFNNFFPIRIMSLRLF